jgi:hypothetical protein
MDLFWLRQPVVEDRATVHAWMIGVSIGLDALNGCVNRYRLAWSPQSSPARCSR